MSLETFVSTAEEQVGNGGSKYQEWYGSSGSWCAMFVSWCANEAGILTTEDNEGFFQSYSSGSKKSGLGRSPSGD